MRIGIDISPLKTGNFVQHRVRGTGFYIENLRSSLLKHFGNNSYTFFTRGEKLPKNIDIVHYPYFEPFFLTLPFRNPAKVVVTVHDLIPFVFPKRFPKGIRGTLKWWIQKWALQRADAIITDSQSSKNDIIRYASIDESKITVVYLASGEEFKRVKISKLKFQSLKRKYRLPEQFALYVGDVTWNKNVPRLLMAANSAQVPLVVVGKALKDKNFDSRNLWNQDLSLSQKISKGSKNIILLGFIPIEELVTLYNIATVFIMPSIYEGFGLPILEAMSCGCPVITSDKGSLKEIAGDAAFFVDPFDENEISRALNLFFYDNKIRNDFSRKGLTQAKKFTWGNTVYKTYRIYEDVLKGKIYE